MPFWTKFWVIVPPIVLIILALISYLVRGKRERK